MSLQVVEYSQFFYVNILILTCPVLSSDLLERIDKVTAIVRVDVAPF